MHTIKSVIVAAIAMGAIAGSISSHAQTSPAANASGPRTLNPGVYPYPDSTDSLKAAPGQHKLLYEDDHVRLLEVTYRPHQIGDAFHGHPYPSVFAFPSQRPQTRDTRLDPTDQGAIRSEGGPPPGMSYPRCRAMAPQLPHRPENQESFPDHFYRVEFKRIDGEAFKTRWAEWYPYMKQRMTVDEWLKTSGKIPFGQAKVTTNPKASTTAHTVNPAGFPYADSYDSINAAPGQHFLRFENENVRFLEVIYRPGERGDALHGHPYSSVFAMDAPFPKVEDEHLKQGELNEGAGRSEPFPGTIFPLCTTMGPQSPHRPHSLDTFPVHFYRIEFKRLDGDGIKEHWREWYPWMTGQSSK
jgi:hypothetical protein